MLLFVDTGKEWVKVLDSYYLFATDQIPWTLIEAATYCERQLQSRLIRIETEAKLEILKNILKANDSKQLHLTTTSNYHI